MAHVHGECSVLLADGGVCRRTARYACSNWHLICASHRSEDSARSAETGCPVCSESLLQFTAIEDGVTPRRRHDDFVGTVGSFFRRAAETWLPEFKENAEDRRAAAPASAAQDEA